MGRGALAGLRVEGLDSSVVENRKRSGESAESPFKEGQVRFAREPCKAPS